MSISDITSRYTSGETITYEEIEALGDDQLRELEGRVGTLREDPGYGYHRDGEVRPFPAGERVESWEGGHDTGVVGRDDEADMPAPDTGMAWVRWDSGVSTWTPEGNLSLEID